MQERVLQLPNSLSTAGRAAVCKERVEDEDDSASLEARQKIKSVPKPP